MGNWLKVLKMVLYVTAVIAVLALMWCKYMQLVGMMSKFMTCI